MRRRLYKTARLLGDLSAVFSGKPDRVIKRMANKWIGKNIVSKLWFK